MTPPINPKPSNLPITPGSSESTGESGAPQSVPTDEAINEVKSKIKLGTTESEISLANYETKISLKDVTNKKERKIGGQKVKINAKTPHMKQPIDIDPTNWETLSKTTDKAKEFLWPKNNWRKAIELPLWVPTGAALLPWHGAKHLWHGAKWLGANTFDNNDKTESTDQNNAPKKSWYSNAITAPIRGSKWVKNNIKTPAHLYNILPFRSKDFLELSKDEKDKFCDKMDKAWEKHQKIYNKGKKENEQILSEDVVSWIFEIPKKKGGRFGFRIIYRIPDEDGMKLKKSNGERKYEVDKNGYFKYKTKYLFLNKLDLDDLDDVLVESSQVVEDWKKIDGVERLTATTKEELKEKIKNRTNSTHQSDPLNSDETSNNCWLHTAIQRVLKNTSMMEVLKIHEFNKDLVAKNSNSPKNLIKCIKECVDKTPDEQKNIIEDAAKDIREDLKLKPTTQEDPEEAYKVLENYLEKAHLIKPFNIKNILILEDGKKFTDPYSHIIINSNKDTSQELIHVEDQINSFLDGRTGINSIRTIDKKDYKVQSSSIVQGKKPSTIAVEINGKKQSNGTFVLPKLDSKSIPLEFSFNYENAVFEFNYATIYKGSDKSGHYYAIYKENDKWFKNDNTKERNIKEISFDQVKEHLKHAKTLVYEDTSIISN